MVYICSDISIVCAHRKMKRVYIMTVECVFYLFFVFLVVVFWGFFVYIQRLFAMHTYDFITRRSYNLRFAVFLCST